MQNAIRRAAILAIAALVVVSLGATPALAQKAKPKRVNAKFVSFDAASNTIVIKERGREKTYTVKPEGSILTRTAVKINGLGAKVSDIPKDAQIIVYWVPDEKDSKMRFARTIDAPNIPEDLQDDFEN